MAYIRKTRDEYEIQGYYSTEYGWETVCTEENMRDAKRTLKLYRENEPYEFRIRKHRVPIA